MLSCPITNGVFIQYLYKYESPRLCAEMTSPYNSNLDVHCPHRGICIGGYKRLAGRERAGFEPTETLSGIERLCTQKDLPSR